MTVWEKLSPLNVNEHTEQKGKFTYLSWAWAWKEVKDSYPDANFELLDDVVYQDGTVEVRVAVTIDSLTHTAFLPVLDFKNKPIQHPNAFDMNTSRMRALVKGLAFHGLGLYLYSGEDLPAPSPVQQEKYEELVSLVANKKGWELRAFTEANKAHMDELFNMSPAGHKTKFKSDVRDLYASTNEGLKSGLAALEAAVGAEIPDPSSVHEILSEMEDLERQFVMSGANEILRKQIEELIQ